MKTHQLPYPGRPFLKAELVTPEQLGERTPAGTGEVLLVIIGGIPCWCFPDDDTWMIVPQPGKSALADGKLLVARASEDLGFEIRDFELLALLDVDPDDLADGRMLQWNTTAGKFGLVDPPTGGGGSMPCSKVMLQNPVMDMGALSSGWPVPWDYVVRDDLNGFNLGTFPTRFTNTTGAALDIRVTVGLYLSIPSSGISTNQLNIPLSIAASAGTHTQLDTTRPVLNGRDVFLQLSHRCTLPNSAYLQITTGSGVTPNGTAAVIASGDLSGRVLSFWEIEKVG